MVLHAPLGSCTCICTPKLSSMEFGFRDFARAVPSRFSVLGGQERLEVEPPLVHRGLSALVCPLISNYLMANGTSLSLESLGFRARALLLGRLKFQFIMSECERGDSARAGWRAHGRWAGRTQQTRLPAPWASTRSPRALQHLPSAASS